MSSASLCGPTNALTNLQKHHSVDRTLQQDRLRTYSISSSSFRTEPTAIGNLNHDFKHFAAGGGFAPFQPHHSFPVPIQHQQAPLLPSWAAEFQGLTLQTSPGPVTAPAFSYGKAAAMGASWHTEFLALEQAAQSTLPLQAQVQAQQQQLHQQRQFRPYSPIQSSYTLQQPYFPQGTSFYAQSSESPGMFTDETVISTTEKSVTDVAFDKAFEEAFEEAQRWQFEATQHDELDAIASGSTTAISSAKETASEGTTELTTESSERPIDPQEDADELSRTAGQLLQTLSNNKSKKFQESSFLALMRRLRDKEVKVEGDKMVEVNKEDLAGK